MTQNPPVIYWMRRDFRLVDNPALCAAVASGRPVVPLFILDEVASARGAAPMWRLEQALVAMRGALEAAGSRLVLRRGKALEVLQQVIGETGAQAVYWARDLAPDAIARDRVVKETLKSQGVGATSCDGLLLWEPWRVSTESGGLYRVFTPFWRRARLMEPDPPLPAPASLSPPQDWPRSEVLGDWQMGRAMDRGAAVLAEHSAPAGEAAGRARLDAFLSEDLPAYAGARDRLDKAVTSGLSAYLALGELSARSIWAAVCRATADGGPGAGKPAEKFLSEVAWREFAYHLIYHVPHLAERSWRPDWEDFPWRGENKDALRWQQGCTGVSVIDAAMREMYVTGTMHNRARMIVASYLTKHLMTDWRVGRAWFEDCLVDWDPAANAMGWQWVAGCGPDAAPFFRIFNPETQAEKFDPDGAYRAKWLPGRLGEMSMGAQAYFSAIPRRWGLTQRSHMSAPSVTLPEGRARALEAYGALREAVG